MSLYTDQSVKQVQRYSQTPLQRLFDGFEDSSDLQLLYRSMLVAQEQVIGDNPAIKAQFARPEHNSVFDSAVSMEIRLAKASKQEAIVNKLGGNEVLKAMLAVQQRFQTEPTIIAPGNS